MSDETHDTGINEATATPYEEAAVQEPAREEAAVPAEPAPKEEEEEEVAAGTATATSKTPSPPDSAAKDGHDASPMRRIYLEKVVLNMGMGRSGDAINIAKKALEQITNGCKPCQRNARGSQRDWGVRKGEPIGAAVTVRGEDAKSLLRRLLEAKGNTVSQRSFDNFGNYSFGIREHIDIPGVKYEPQIGILGLGVSVALARPGYSIRKRGKHRASIGKSHAITGLEASNYMASEFEVQVTT